MEHAPKIVRDRLRASAVAVDHPDADVLTAFSERTLPERERNQVLGHLAKCTDCREVIALALPADEPTLAVVHPTRGKWLTWPRLRWGLVAAGVIVVGSFGVLRYERSMHPAAIAGYVSSRRDAVAKEAKNQPAPIPSVAEEAQTQKTMTVPAAPSSAVPRPNATAEPKREFDRLEASDEFHGALRDQNVLVADSAGGTRLRSQALPHGPKPPVQQWQQNAMASTNNYADSSQSQLPVAPPPFAKQQAGNGVLVTARPPAPSATAPSIGGPVSVDNKAQTLDSLAANGRSTSLLVPSGSNSGAEVARAKPADTTVNAPQAQAAAAYTVSAAEGSNFSPSGSLVAESARWAINSAGGLQRSLDQGKTWQDVDVNSGAGDYEAKSLPLAMKSSRAKAPAKDKAESKVKPIVFRAVSANGPDVWAGGSETNLYHSTDSGGHWARVLPSWRGIELSGDIINLQFADTQHGRIITSSAEIWTTADAGQTWDKQ